jgi:hypothetical protein
MSAERKAARRLFLHPGPSAAAAPPSSAASVRHTEHKEERQHGEDEDEVFFSSPPPPSPSPLVRPRDGTLPARRATALLPVAVPVDPSAVPTALPVLDAYAIHSSDDDDAIEAASPSPPTAAATGSSRRPHIAQQGRRGRWMIAGTAAILVLVALVVGLSVGLTTTTSSTQGTAAAPTSSGPAAPTASPSIGTGNCTEERSIWYRCGGYVVEANTNNGTNTTTTAAYECEKCVAAYFATTLHVDYYTDLRATPCEDIDNESCEALLRGCLGWCQQCADEYLAYFQCASQCPLTGLECPPD